VHPDDWKALPSIATAVAAAAKADGVAIDSVDAWGDPARGCYAVWLDLHREDTHKDAAVLANQLLASFQNADARSGSGSPIRPSSPSSPSGWSIRDVVRPTGESGVLALSFARAPYLGRVRAGLGEGRIAMTACFHNEREPVACDAACTRVLEAPP
jgi:hypothetical protein